MNKDTRKLLGLLRKVEYANRAGGLPGWRLMRDIKKELEQHDVELMAEYPSDVDKAYDEQWEETG